MNGNRPPRWKATLIFLVMLIGSASSALATGMGFFGQSGTGSSDWTVENYYGTNKFSADNDHTGFGIVLDTNLSGDRLFNYRLSIASDEFDRTLTSGTGYQTLTMEGFTIDNDFGFGIVRTPAVRLWMGPELRFFFYDGTPPTDPGTDINLAGAGIGAVLGLNVNIGPVVTLGFKAGYLFNQYGGEADSVSSWSDYEVEEDLVYGQFALIFRFGEEF